MLLKVGSETIDLGRREGTIRLADESSQFTLHKFDFIFERQSISKFTTCQLSSSNQYIGSSTHIIQYLGRVRFVNTRNDRLEARKHGLRCSSCNPLITPSFKPMMVRENIIGDKGRLIREDRKRNHLRNRLKCICKAERLWQFKNWIDTLNKQGLNSTALHLVDEVAHFLCAGWAVICVFIG